MWREWHVAGSTDNWQQRRFLLLQFTGVSLIRLHFQFEVNEYVVQLTSVTGIVDRWSDREKSSTTLFMFFWIYSVVLYTRVCVWILPCFPMSAFFMSKYTVYKPRWRSSLHQGQSQSVRCRSAFTNRPKPIQKNKKNKTNKNKSPTCKLSKMPRF